jgi:hypothetical protein
MCKAVKPTGQSDYQEMERLYGVYHCTITLSLIFSDNNIIRLVRIFAPYGLSGKSQVSWSNTFPARRGAYR